MPKRYAAASGVAPNFEARKEKLARSGRAAADRGTEEAKNSVNGKREEARLRSPALPSPAAWHLHAALPTVLVQSSPT